jgi:hypothetical protein
MMRLSVESSEMIDFERYPPERKALAIEFSVGRGGYPDAVRYSDVLFGVDLDREGAGFDSLPGATWERLRNALRAQHYSRHPFVFYLIDHGSERSRLGVVNALHAEDFESLTKPEGRCNFTTPGHRIAAVTRDANVRMALVGKLGGRISRIRDSAGNPLLFPLIANCRLSQDELRAIEGAVGRIGIGWSEYRNPNGGRTALEIAQAWGLAKGVSPAEPKREETAEDIALARYIPDIDRGKDGERAPVGEGKAGNLVSSTDTKEDLLQRWRGLKRQSEPDKGKEG